MTIYKVLLKNGTTGTIDSDTIDGQHSDDFIGERVTVHLHDGNGKPIEVEGVMVETLEELN